MEKLPFLKVFFRLSFRWVSRGAYIVAGLQVRIRVLGKSSGGVVRSSVLTTWLLLERLVF